MLQINRIMVIEDSVDDFFVIRRELKKLSEIIDIVHYQTGESLLADVANAFPKVNNIVDPRNTCILMDINLPGINGFETIRLLKTEYPFFKCLLMILSNSSGCCLSILSELWHNIENKTRMIFAMTVKIVSQKNHELTLQVTINISGSMLEAEESILDACNEIGMEATKVSLERFDTDGTPIKIGTENFTVKSLNTDLVNQPLKRTIFLDNLTISEEYHQPQQPAIYHWAY